MHFLTQLFATYQPYTCDLKHAKPRSKRVGTSNNNNTNNSNNSNNNNSNSNVGSNSTANPNENTGAATDVDKLHSVSSDESDSGDDKASAVFILRDPMYTMIVLPLPFRSGSEFERALSLHQQKPNEIPHAEKKQYVPSLLCKLLTCVLLLEV